MRDSAHTEVFDKCPRVFTLPPEEFQRLLEEIGELLTRDKRVAFACLFGSASEGDPFRDLDIGVYLVDARASEEPTDADGARWKIENELGSRLELVVRERTGLAVPVDLRIVDEAPLDVQFRVLRGRLLALRDAAAYARVFEYVVPRHLDMAPLRVRALGELVGRS
jgi:predicted nucleotidyltransferase